jgi:hypothetical protein
MTSRAFLLSSALLAAVILPASAEAAMRNFFLPQIDGTRVDSCLASGSCGKPAADAFCKLEGYDRAMIFQRESVLEARAIDSDQLCAGQSCSSFRQIKCFTTKSDLAALDN